MALHPGHDEEFVHERQAEGETQPEPGKMMAEHFQMARWIQIPLVVLGLWLIASPFTLGYPGPALVWSDLLSGALVIVFVALAFFRRYAWANWANTFVGLWLLFAPLAFWAPDAGAYANDTLVGSLVITFSILIPMRMPMPGPQIPFEWSYNPSTWLQRAPIIALGLISFFLARYMAAFQLGHIDTVWEPFFGDGTIRILTSDISRAWPVSDAGLVAFIYMIEVLSDFMGDQRRWRSMPWMVAIFGLRLYRSASSALCWSSCSHWQSARGAPSV